MAFRMILDSDVDRLTALAIQGVTSFISLYEMDERADEPVTAAGGTGRAAAHLKPRATRAPGAATGAAARPTKGPPRRRL